MRVAFRKQFLQFERLCFLEEVLFPRHQVGFNLLSFFAGTDEWKASKFYQNAALKVEGQRLWISLTFGVLRKPTNL